MNQQDLHHLAAAYALDAVTPDERRAFQAHYPSCEICSREVAEFRETAAFLAAGASATPPPDLKERVMAEVANTHQLPVILPDKVIDLAEQRRTKSNLGAALIGAAAAAVVAVLGTVAALRTSSGADTISDLLATPDAVVTSLEGNEGTLRVVWSADRAELAVVGAELADPGPERAYELWFVLDAGGVAPAGLFHPDRDGTVETIINTTRADDIAGFGVTVEPEEGSPQPTSEIIFSSSF